MSSHERFDGNPEHGAHDHAHHEHEQHAREHHEHDGHEHRHHEHHERERVFVIYVDDVRYDVHHAHRTGAELKALTQRPAQYQLFQERPGEPDLLVSDTQVVALKDGEHFYTIPPAQFG